MSYRDGDDVELIATKVLRQPYQATDNNNWQTVYTADPRIFATYPPFCGNPIATEFKITAGQGWSTVRIEIGIKDFEKIIQAMMAASPDVTMQLLATELARGLTNRKREDAELVNKTKEQAREQIAKNCTK